MKNCYKSLRRHNWRFFGWLDECSTTEYGRTAIYYCNTCGTKKVKT